MRCLNACLLSFVVSIASVAAGQPRSPEPRPGNDASAASLDPAANALPEVNDPMLEPMSAPAHMLSSWRDAVELVRARSTSVGVAKARIADAHARARQARSLVLPEINGSGSVQRSLLFGTGTAFTVQGVRAPGPVPFPATVWNAGVSLRQSVVDVRSWYDLATASRGVRAAEASAEDAERLALGGLADTIVTVITAERLAEVSRVSLRSNLSTLDLTQRRMRLGAASAVDVLRAEQEVASNRLDVVQADESLRQAREALGMALGYPEAWGVAPNIKVDSLAADAQSVCTPVSDPEQRSDVRAARLAAEVSERNEASVSYGLAPRLDVVSDFSYTTQPQVARPEQWSVGAVLTVPIYDGGRLSAERGINAAAADTSRLQLTEAARTAHLQVAQAQRSIQVAEANFAVSRQARDIAEESARLSRIAFVHGTGTSFDLVESARRQRLAEIDVTIREFEVVRAKVSALLALSNCDL